jgi:hypothetical protein
MNIPITPNSGVRQAAMQLLACQEGFSWFVLTRMDKSSSGHVCGAYCGVSGREYRCADAQKGM